MVMFKSGTRLRVQRSLLLLSSRHQGTKRETVTVTYKVEDPTFSFKCKKVGQTPLFDKEVGHRYSFGWTWTSISAAVDMLKQIPDDLLQQYIVYFVLNYFQM